MNYGTLFSIAIDTMSSGTGQKLFKGLSEKIDTTITTVSKAQESVKRWNNIARDKLEVIDMVATLADNSEVKALTQEWLGYSKSLDEFLSSLIW